MSARSPAVRRIMQEATELATATDCFTAHPLEENLFEWHFTIRGTPDSPYAGGVYHGRIMLPNDYPMKPPDVMMLSPSGRFETGSKICLSISGFHPENWQPSWSIRTVLIALIAFMPTPGKGAVGSIECRPERRAEIAKESRHWKCKTCSSVLGDELKEMEAAKVHVDASMLPPPSASGERPKKDLSASPAPSTVSAQPTVSFPAPKPAAVVLVGCASQTPPPRAPVHAPQPPVVHEAPPNSLGTGLLLVVFIAIFLALLSRRLSTAIV